MHQNLTEEVNNKRKEHSGESYKNLSEDEKQELVEYRKGYH